MKRLRAGLLAFSLLTPVAGPAWADAASEALAQSFVASLDSLDGWSAKAAGVTSAGDVTTITGLELKEDAGGLTAGFATVDFSALKAGDGGGFSAAAIVAKDFKSVSGGVTATAPLVDVKNFATPGLGAWTFDIKRPIATVAGLYTRLSDTEFDGIAIPSVSVAVDNQYGFDSKTTYRDIRYEAMKGGVLGLFTIAEFLSSTEGADAGSAGVDFRSEGMYFKNLDLKVFSRVFDPAAYKDGRGDMVWRTAVESGSYGKMSFAAAGRDTGSIASIAFGAVEYRQPEKPFTDALDVMAVNDEFKDDDKAAAFLVEHIASLTGWIKFKALSIDGVEVLPPEGGSVKLKRMSLADFSADGLGGFSLEGASFDAPQASGKLDLFQMSGFVWPSLAVLAQIGFMAERAEAGAPPSPEVVSLLADRFLELYPRIGSLNIQGFSAGAAGLPPVTMESYTTTMTGDFAGGLPAESNVEMKALVIPGALLRLDPSSAQVVDALGYGDLVFGFKGNGAYDGKTGAYGTSAALSGADIGTLAMSYALSGFTPERVKAFVAPILASGGGDPDPMALLAASAGLALDKVELRFDDASLTRRVLKFGAQMQGMDEKTLIANAAAMAQLGLSQLNAPDFAAKTAAAITAYLNDPKSITLRVQPPVPVQAVNLMGLDPNNPKAALDLFGVSVTAND